MTGKMAAENIMTVNAMTNRQDQSHASRVINGLRGLAQRQCHAENVSEGL